MDYDSSNDFISLWEEYLSFQECPRKFKVASGVSLLAALVHNGVYCKTIHGYSFPNLYTFLIGDPSSQKGVVLRAVKDSITAKAGLGIKVSVSDSTMEALIDAIASSQARYVRPDVMGSKRQGVSMYIIEEEIADFFMRVQDSIPKFTKLWDNPAEFVESRRSRKDAVKTIAFPCLNYLMSGQPDAMISTFNESAWLQGFMSRHLLVYSTEVFDGDEDITAVRDVSDRERISKALAELRAMYSTIRLHELTLCKEVIPVYNEIRKELKFTDDRLATYNKRRPYTFLKLCMLSCVSRKSKEIVAFDVERAKGWQEMFEDNLDALIQKMCLHKDVYKINLVLNSLIKFPSNEINSMQLNKLITGVSGQAYARYMFLAIEPYLKPIGPNARKYTIDKKQLQNELG